MSIKFFIVSVLLIVAFGFSFPIHIQAQGPTPLPNSTLSYVDIVPSVITSTLTQGPSHLSALAYDQNQNPIFSNITYEWGISSDNSIGTLSPNHNIAEFTPLNLGHGSLWVIARDTLGNSVTKSIPIDIIGQSAYNIADINQDGSVNFQDFILLIQNFGMNPPQIARSDINQDSQVNFSDFILLIQNFGQTTQ